MSQIYPTRLLRVFIMPAVWYACLQSAVGTVLSYANADPKAGLPKWLADTGKSSCAIHSFIHSFIIPSAGLCFVILYTDSGTPCRADQRGCCLHPRQRTQASVPQMGFEPTTPAFGWAKKVHASYRATTANASSLASNKQKQTPWPLARKRTIPTDDRRLSAKFSANFCG
jgi:hypothetical protein